MSDDEIDRIARDLGLRVGQHWNKEAMRTPTMRAFARACMVPEQGRIAELEAALAEAQMDMAAMIATLPGALYMDPPDGGSVSLDEQLRRMAVDAERYRWLRDSKIADDADRWICAHECTVHEVAELDGERLDAAIDRARGAG